MASAEREPITGSGGGTPSGVQGQRSWSGVQAAKTPEAESFEDQTFKRRGKLASRPCFK